MCFPLFVYQIAFSLLCGANCLNLKGSGGYRCSGRQVSNGRRNGRLATDATPYLCTFIRGEQVLLLYSRMELSWMCLKEALFLRGFKPLNT